MSSIQIISDLHLEAPKSYALHEISPKAPYLALLGDIGCTSHKDDYLDFLRRHLLKFKIVFLVMGNHEPYHSTWDKSRQVLRDFETQIQAERATVTTPSTLGEFILLDRNSYTLSTTTALNQPITILGCTLFSGFTKNSSTASTLSQRLNDFRVTGDDWSPEDHADAHIRDLNWLNEQVTSLQQQAQQPQQAQHKIIILTHHSPTFDPRASDPRHIDSPIKSGFATDLSKQPCWTSGMVKLWAFGHTHYNCDFVEEVSGIRVYTNQRGYCFQQSPGYDEGKVVEI